jgi:hypothetical protein
MVEPLLYFPADNFLSEIKLPDGVAETLSRRFQCEAVK